MIKVRKQSKFPLNLLLQLVERPLILGCEIIATHDRGIVLTGTMADLSGHTFKWKWRLPLVARQAYLRGWSPSYLVQVWFGLLEEHNGSFTDLIYRPGSGPDFNSKSWSESFRYILQGHKF